MKKKFKDCGTEKIGFFFKKEKKYLFGSLVIPCGFLKLYNVYVQNIVVSLISVKLQHVNCKNPSEIVIRKCMKFF